MTSGGVGDDLWPKRRGRKAGEGQRKKDKQREELKAVEKEIEEMPMYRKRGFYGSSGQGGQFKEK